MEKKDIDFTMVAQIRDEMKNLPYGERADDRSSPRHKLNKFCWFMGLTNPEGLKEEEFYTLRYAAVDRHPRATGMAALLLEISKGHVDRDMQAFEERSPLLGILVKEENIIGTAKGLNDNSRNLFDGYISEVSDITGKKEIAKLWDQYSIEFRNLLKEEAGEVYSRSFENAMQGGLDLEYESTRRQYDRFRGVERSSKAHPGLIMAVLMAQLSNFDLPALPGEEDILGMSAKEIRGMALSMTIAGPLGRQGRRD